MAEYDLSVQPLDESAPIAPQTLYAEAKATTYRLLTQLRGSATRPTLQWLRIGHFFGEEEPPEKFFSTVIRRMLSNEPIYALSQDAVRDYAHVDAVGSLIARLLENDESFPLNVTGGSPHTIGFLLENLAELTSYRHKIHYGDYHPLSHEPKILVPQTSRLELKEAHINQDDFVAQLKKLVEHIRNVMKGDGFKSEAMQG